MALESWPWWPPRRSDDVRAAIRPVAPVTEDQPGARSTRRWGDADDVGAPIDLLVEPLGQVGALP